MCLEQYRETVNSFSIREVKKEIIHLMKAVNNWVNVNMPRNVEKELNEKTSIAISIYNSKLNVFEKKNNNL